MIFQTLRNVLLPASQARCRNDGSQRLLRHTLSALLVMTVMLTPCQAAVKFDGVNDYIDIKALSLSNTSNFTISTWVKLNSAPAPYATVISLEESMGYLRIDINTSRQANGYIFTGAQNYIGLTTLNLNQWYNLTYARNGTDYRFFVDGVLQESRSLGNPVGGAGIEAIGARNITGSNYNIDGLIDDTKIYNRPLSNGEILALYNSRSKRPSGTLANGLIAHYEMDDDAIGEITAQAKDRSGNLNHGQFIGFDNLTTALSKDVPAQIGVGHSLKFDGVNDKISASNGSSLNNWNEQTITVWIKADSTALGSDLRIIEKGANNEWTLTTNRNGLIGQVGLQVGSSTYRGVNTTTLSNDNQWHFIAGRISSNYFTELFVDNERGSIATTGTGSTKSGDISIGEFGGGPSNRFQGLIDDIRIYDRVLTNGEISFLYNGSGLDPGTSNLQALWTFDDDSALKDSSGNNHHGFGFGGDSLKYSEGVLKR